MNLFIITPYEAMLTPIKSAINAFPELLIDYDVGDLEEGVELALKAEESGFDAIISRGGTAKLIQEKVKIPVIDMKLSGYDILRTIVLTENQKEKTALIGFSNITSGANAIIDLLNLSIDIYTIKDQDELNPILLKLKENNITQIIGDVITIKKSKDLNFNSILLQSGEETIKAAVKQAYFILNQLAQEKNINSLLAKSFNFMISDYLIMDDESILTTKFDNFEEIPISTEKIMNYIYELQYKQKNTFYTFILTDFKLSITAMTFDYYNHKYYLLHFKSLSAQQINVYGVSLYTRNSSYKLVDQSTAMKTLLKKIDEAFSRKDIIYLMGEDRYTQENIIEHIENIYSSNNAVLEINLDYVDLPNFFNLNLKEYTMIILNEIKDPDKFSKFINYMKSKDIPILILEEKEYNNPIVNNAEVSPIKLPSISERIADLNSIAKHLISYYHNNQGTKPVKIEQGALDYFKGHANVSNIDTVVSILKIAIFEENSYTLSLSTIMKAGNNNEFSNNTDDFPDTSKTLKELEIEYIKKILEQEDFNQSQTAERLGISRATLWRKLKNNQL